MSDFGAVFHSVMVVIGDRLGLYKALSGETLTSAELAERTGIIVLRSLPRTGIPPTFGSYQHFA